MFRGKHVAGKSIYFAFALRMLIFNVSVFVLFVLAFDCCVSLSYTFDFQALGDGFVHRTISCYVYLYVCVRFFFNICFMFTRYVAGKP